MTWPAQAGVAAASAPDRLAATLDGILAPLAAWVAGSRRGAEAGAGDELAARRMDAALDLIERRCAENPTAAEAAALCGLSASRFLHAFKDFSLTKGIFGSRWADPSTSISGPSSPHPISGS